MNRQLSLAPHDDITYLSALARLLELDLAHLVSCVEIEYTSQDATRLTWFAAVRGQKADLIRQELATVRAQADSLPGLRTLQVQGLDPYTLLPRGLEPLSGTLDGIRQATQALLLRYETGGCPLTDTKAVLAALARCMVATRRLEPAGFSRTLTKIHVHLMLLVGQYELMPATT